MTPSVHLTLSIPSTLSDHTSLSTLSTLLDHMSPSIPSIPSIPSTLCTRLALHTDLLDLGHLSIQCTRTRPCLGYLVDLSSPSCLSIPWVLSFLWHRYTLSTPSILLALPDLRYTLLHPYTPSALYLRYTLSVQSGLECQGLPSNHEALSIPSDLPCLLYTPQALYTLVCLWALLDPGGLECRECHVVRLLRLLLSRQGTLLALLDQ